MHFCNYKQSIEKIQTAKRSHIEAMDALISTTLKFLTAAEIFENENLLPYSEILNMLQEQTKVQAEISNVLPLFISNDVNSPTAYDAIRSFFQNHFLPELKNIKSYYVSTFDNDFSAIQKMSTELNVVEQNYKAADAEHQKLVNNLEKHHGNKKQEDLFNTEAFQYKTVRQACVDSIDAYNKKKYEYELECDKFFSKYEELEHSRMEKMKILFLNLSEVLTKGCEKAKDLGHNINSAYDNIKCSMEYDEIIKYEVLRKTHLPEKHNPIKNEFSFNIYEFIDPSKIFTSELHETYAISQIDILVNQTKLASVGEKVKVISEEDGYLLYNQDKTVKTIVAKDLFQVPEKYKRYIAKIVDEENPSKNTVCVLETDENCQCITMDKEIISVPLEKIKKL